MQDSRKQGAAGSTRLVKAAPAVIVHGAAAARAAVALADPARGLVLLSAPGAGLYAGAGWFAALARAAARPNVPMLAVLDCGPAPGGALAAFRAGLLAVVFTGDAAAAARLRDIGLACGAIVLQAAPPALDLADFRRDDPWWQERLRTWLGGGAG